jgi:hypothetical protein
MKIAPDEASSNTLILDVDHLRGASNRNVHLVRWCNLGDRVEACVRAAATALNYHVALLDGRTLRTEDDVLRALDGAFQFPKWSPDPVVENWNGAADWLGDLAWLFAPPSTNKGLVVLLRDPESFIVANLLQFAFLIDTLGQRSQWVMHRGHAVHVVLGPLPHDSRYENFLNLMSVSKYFCEACQSVDCPCDEEELQHPVPGAP